MVESANPTLALRFDRRLQREFRGATITSAAHRTPVRDAARCFCPESSHF